MQHLREPEAGAGVVPITQPVYVEGSQVRGIAIALQLVGTATNYLVVCDDLQSAPVWVSESHVDLAYIGERPTG